MPDYSKLSDEELLRLYQQQGGSAPSQAATTNPAAANAPENPFAAMSDEELLDLHRKQTGAPQRRDQSRPNSYGLSDEVLAGLTLNSSDEILSGAMTPIEMGAQWLRGEDVSAGSAYRKLHGDYAAEQEEWRQANPGQAIGGNIGGSVMVGGAAAPRIIARGAGTLMNTVRSIAGGAGLGATAEFNDATTLEDRIANAPGGAIIGGTFGAVAPAAGQAVGAATRALAGRGANRAAAQAAGVSPGALNRFSRALQDEGLDAAGAEQRLAELGPDAMPVDLGPNLQRQGAAIASLPGPGQATMRAAVEGRAGRAGERIAAASDASLGNRVNVANTMDDLIARRSAESAPAYARALNRPVAWNNRLQQFLDDPVARQGLRRGVEIQRLESLARNEPFNPTDYAITGFNEAGDPIISGVPNMRTLNVIKKGLDDVIEGYRDPVTRRLALDERGRAINEVQRSFIRELDSINPDYAQARRTWEGPTRVRNALVDGQDLFSKSVRPDALRNRWRDMPEAEREAFILGARDAVDEVMGTARNDALAARTMLQKGWNREKLQIVLGEEQANRLIQAVESEATFGATRGVVAHGPETAARIAAQREFTPGQGSIGQAVDAGLGMAGFAAGGMPGAAAGVAVGRGSRAGMNALERAALRRTGADTANLLTAPATQREAIIQALLARQTGAPRQNAVSERNAMLARALLLSGGQQGGQYLPQIQR